MLAVEVDPAEAGFDRARLERIDRHFARYVDDGRLTGYLAVVARDGRVAHVAAAGQADREAGRPVAPDTLWRIYSMTKPITTVAALSLWEEGAFELTDPVARFLPAFAEPRVFAGGTPAKPVTVPAREPIRMWHLLTHTAGLSYGFHHAHPVDALYRQAGFDWGSPPGLDLAGCCDVWARLPLLFEPGSEWTYSHATDVLGRVLEVLCGRPLDAVLAERVLDPLRMRDTGFDPADPARLAALYVPDPATGGAVRDDALAEGRRRFLSGGGGLISSAADYHRFAQLLLGGGALDGVRVLGPRTVRLMATNQLPGNRDLEQFGRRVFSETPQAGIGFGLGVSVVLDPVATRTATSAGELGWGGAASTAFWVDPAERLSVLFFTQLLPSSTHPIRPQLHQLVRQALVD